MKLNQLVKGITVTALIVMLFTLISVVAYADPQGANSTFVQTSTGTVASPTTQQATGGNVTAVNINGTAITGRWTGFYGNISGLVKLADSTGNKFYQWTVTTITGSVVYASNGTISNWSTLAAARYQDMPSYLQQSAADNYTNTFTTSENFVDTWRTVTGVNYTYTLNASGQQSQFKTYAMTADVSAPANDNSTIVFAGKAVGSSNAFNGQSADFQIIAPAQTLTTYYFYLELP